MREIVALARQCRPDRLTRVWSADIEKGAPDLLLKALGSAGVPGLCAGRLTVGQLKKRYKAAARRQFPRNAQD